MTCHRAIKLIDAAPFAAPSRTDLDAARKHVSQCQVCSRVIATSTALDAGLRALPQVVAPVDLDATVMARIRRLDEPEANPGAVANAAAAAARSANWREWVALGSLAAGTALLTWVSAHDRAPADLLTLRLTGFTDASSRVPATLGAALALALGLVLFASGLFAPLGGRSERQRRPHPRG